MYTLITKQREISHSRLISAMEQMAELKTPCTIIKENSEDPWMWDKRRVDSVDENYWEYYRYGGVRGDRSMDEEDFISEIHERIEKEAMMREEAA